MPTDPAEELTKLRAELAEANEMLQRIQVVDGLYEVGFERGAAAAYDAAQARAVRMLLRADLHRAGVSPETIATAMKVAVECEAADRRKADLHALLAIIEGVLRDAGHDHLANRLAALVRGDASKAEPTAVEALAETIRELDAEADDLARDVRRHEAELDVSGDTGWAERVDAARRVADGDRLVTFSGLAGPRVVMSNYIGSAVHLTTEDGETWRLPSAMRVTVRRYDDDDAPADPEPQPTDDGGTDVLADAWGSFRRPPDPEPQP